MAVSDEDLQYRVHFEDQRGRILVGNSLTSYEHGSFFRDVTVGASFAGVPTGVVPLRQGSRGWIAHEAGPGLDRAGIGGLAVSDDFGVPAAAISTNTARLSDGDSLLAGTVSEVNRTAAALGLRPGQTGEDAAHLMLRSDEGRPRAVGHLVDERTLTIRETASGNIYSCWSFSRVVGEHPDAVFLVASHGAKIMALYALRVKPRGLICNDAGFGLDNSGIEGLFELDDHGIGAAAVSADTARIGDPTSTYGGTISAVNAVAASKGVEVGQSAVEAAGLLLD